MDLCSEVCGLLSYGEEGEGRELKDSMLWLQGCSGLLVLFSFCINLKKKSSVCCFAISSFPYGAASVAPGESKVTTRRLLCVVLESWLSGPHSCLSPDACGLQLECAQPWCSATPSVSASTVGFTILC